MFDNEPKTKAAFDFEIARKKNNTFKSGTLDHKAYEKAWSQCLDKVIERQNTQMVVANLKGVSHG